MNIYCIGNSDVKGDDIPSTLVPFLSREFPLANVTIVDPTENFTPEAGSILIDSVEGINTVQIFCDLDSFVGTTRVSVHDFDLLLHLQLLKKLNKLNDITILGVPQYGDLAVIQSQIHIFINKSKRGV